MNTLTPLEQVRAWSIPERLEFLFQVWDEVLNSGWQPTLTPELHAELDRRLTAYHAAPNDVKTWEQIEARLQGQS